MKRLIFILMMVGSLVQAQERYGYEYGVNNGGVKINVRGGTGLEDAKILQILEYVPSCFNGATHINKCGEQVLSVVYEKIIGGAPALIVDDIPAGVYTFQFRYAPQGQNLWCTECDKARFIEIVNDSKYICINRRNDE